MLQICHPLEEIEALVPLQCSAAQSCCIVSVEETNYRKLWLLGPHYVLGACFLPGTQHHLLSACALNRVHADNERLSENHGIKNMQYT